MQKLKTIAPFFLAILLLFLAAFLPIFLCRLQDNSMLGVAHLEPLPTAEPFEEGHPLSAAEKISLICDYGRIGSNIVLTKRQNSKSYSSKKNDLIPEEKVFAELKKLQSLGAFPDLPLDDEPMYYSTSYTYMDVDHPSRIVNILDYSFSVEDYHCTLTMDADTNQIYQYNIRLNGQPLSFDTQSAFAAFSRYLLLDEEHEKLYYFVFQENNAVILALKAMRSMNNI